MKIRIAFRMFLGFALMAGSLNVEAGESAPPPWPRFSRPRQITNPYLPLAALKQDILASKTGRIERTARPDLHKTFKVGDQTVDALVVQDREFEGGKLAEVALDYFAQADDGTVYYLGEDVDEYKNGKVSGHSGAWLFGKDTQKLGVIMPAHPKAGDKFRSEDVPNITWEEDEIIAVSETVTVPAGTFARCVKIREKLSGGVVEHKYYAPGAGCVKEVEPAAEFLLQSHQTQDQQSSQAPLTKEPIQDPLARVALGFVGYDSSAEAYWVEAINDPRLSAQERQDLIEDLNEDGLSDPRHPGVQDVPLIVNRLRLIEELAPDALDQVNWDAFMEAYQDLGKMLAGRPVP